MIMFLGNLDVKGLSDGCLRDYGSGHGFQGEIGHKSWCLGRVQRSRDKNQDDGIQRGYTLRKRMAFRERLILTWSLRVHCSVQMSVMRLRACLAISSKNMLHRERLRSPIWCLCMREKTEEKSVLAFQTSLTLLRPCRSKSFYPPLPFPLLLP